MHQWYREKLQLAKSVVKDVNFYVNKYCYGYKAFQIHELNKYYKDKVKN